MNRAEVIKLDRIKLVSWDVDNTLYSVGRMKWRLMGLLLREIASGRGRAARRELAALRRYRASIDAARAAGGALGEALRKESRREILLNAERRWYGHAIRRTGPRAGVADLLSFLAARDIPQVALSDYEAAYKLQALGLEDSFVSIYVGEVLGFVKPSPKVFERIAADFEVPPASLLHIGDRADADDLGARAAGCQCLILGRDFRDFISLLSRFRTAL